MESESDSARHGIGGPLALLTADKNNDRVVLHVHHVLGDDLSASTHITHDQLRKAAGISHMNNHRITGATIETTNYSDGLVAVTVKSGDGETIPLTDRACVIGPDGSMAAANHVATPNATTTSKEMHLKQLSTDKHGFIPVSKMPADVDTRNRLNAAFYAGSSSAPSDADMFKHTVRSTNGTDERVAIPLKDRLTSDDGVLTAVASRCIVHQKKTAASIGGADARVVTMPHKITGEDCKHLVVSSASAQSIAETIKTNTKVHGTFGNGIIISSHGGMSEHARPGDHVITKLTLHRSPTGDPAEVSYLTDLMPADVQGSAAPNEATAAAATVHDDIYKKLMWSTKGATTAQIVSAECADEEA